MLPRPVVYQFNSLDALRAGLPISHFRAVANVPPPPAHPTQFFWQSKHFQLPAAVLQERTVKLLPNHLYPLQLERGLKPQVRLSCSLAVIGISRDECAKRVSDGCSLAFKEIMDGAVSGGGPNSPS